MAKNDLPRNREVLKYSHEKQNSELSPQALHKLVLLCFFGVFLLEFIDTTRRIHQHILAGKERVRRIGNFQLYQRVFVTVFPLYGFFGNGCGTAQEGMAVAHVFENY